MLRVALGLAACTWSVVTYAQEPVSLAIVREDGYLVPVVSIVGNKYTPLTAFRDSENKSLFTPEAVALRDSSWTLWRRGTSTPEPIKVLNRAMVHNHCTDEEAWRTTVQGKPVAKHVSDIKKIGVAVRGGEVQFPEDITAQPDNASRRVVQRITFLTHAGAEGLQTEIRRLAPDARTTNIVTLDKLIRHRTDESTYYFEAVKKYGFIGAVTQGWIVESDTGLRVHGVRSWADDGEAKTHSRADVLAVVRRGTASLWLVIWHGYEGEGYVIHEWPSGRAIDNLGGGGC